MPVPNASQVRVHHDVKERCGHRSVQPCSPLGLVCCVTLAPHAMSGLCCRVAVRSLFVAFRTRPIVRRLPKVSLRVNGCSGWTRKAGLETPPTNCHLSLWTPCSTTQHSKDTRRSEQQPRPRLFWQTHHFVSIEPCRGVDDVSSHQPLKALGGLAFSPTFEGSAEEDGLSVEEPGRHRKR